MKIKPAFRYYCEEGLKSTGIFYGIIFALFLLMMVPLRLLAGEGFYSTSGTDMSSFIFVFVLGLNSFKGQFRMLMQNGISRRTLFLSFALYAAGLSLCVALVDSIFPLAFGKLLNYESTVKMIFSGSNWLTGVIWQWSMSLLTMALGFLVTTLFYRLGKGGKLALSIGLPVFFFIILPVVGAIFPQWNLWSSLWQALLWFLGGFNPVVSAVRLLPVTLVLGAFGFLLVRRAPVREA